MHRFVFGVTLLLLIAPQISLAQWYPGSLPTMPERVQARRMVRWNRLTMQQVPQARTTSLQRIQKEVTPWSRSMRRVVSGRDYQFIEAIRGEVFVVRTPNGSTKEVHILGIEAPDIINQYSDCYGVQSRDMLNRLLSGLTVQLRKEDGYHYDSYGRMVRHVFSGGRNIGSFMIRNGYAFADKDPDHAHSLQQKYIDDQAEAKVDGPENQGIGLWSGACDYQPSIDYSL